MRIRQGLSQFESRAEKERDMYEEMARKSMESYGLKMPTTLKDDSPSTPISEHK